MNIDLGFFHRKAHAVTFKESMTWTVVWVTLALAFNVGVWHFAGPQKGLEFFTGYVIEKSLSVDKVFVFALAGVMDKFHYLKIGLGAVLTFVGVKMLLAHSAWKIPTLPSLGVIVLILAAAVVASLLRPRAAKSTASLGRTSALPKPLANPTN